jgi:hypothetical protein
MVLFATQMTIALKAALAKTGMIGGSKHQGVLPAAPKLLHSFYFAH